MAKKTKQSKPTETPLMQQYRSIKGKHPDAILLFRVGDFYETFGEDAVRAASILGIVLTKRKNGAASHVELAGFPHHSLDTYLPKLVKAGQRVAICDQLEDPKQTKTIVKRGITELVTPGVSFNDKILENKTNNFLAAIHLLPQEAGIAFLDVSTGEFLVAQGTLEYAEKLIQSFQPSEVLVQRDRARSFRERFGDNLYTYHLDDWAFTSDFGEDQLLQHFGTNSLKGFGIEDVPSGVIAAGACLQYLKETQHHRLAHIRKISRIERNDSVWLDKFTVRNLELFHTPHEGAKTALDVLDRTCTPMGSRLLKRWLAFPLKNLAQIQERHQAVDTLLTQATVRHALQEKLHQMGDLERLISRVAVKRVSPREVDQLRKSLDLLPTIQKQLQETNEEALLVLADQLNLCPRIRERIERELAEDPPVQIGKGQVIASGINAELDELRSLAHSSKDYLKQMQEREAARTGIQSLKIGFNNVFGYYFEVRNTFKEKVPTEWIRKQTLVNAERYITEELKEYEARILGAEEKILAWEQELFQKLVDALAEYTEPIQLNASLLARLDCLLSFSEIAERNHYSKPVMNDSLALDIKGGRHPVIEQQLPSGEEYIANDIYLSNEDQQIMMITGPNMAGKSALLRQTALITLFAQIGSFVPATKATLGVVDKVFTRVGASDNISMGESTFMVEMNETASILNNLSERSLILLDEIGRGTSTYDGISIAWAIAEFIHQSRERPKTLFATHYHELNEMAPLFERIRNFNVAIKEVNNRILFIRKLVPGGSNHSFGIHVAQMAGMPGTVIDRANTVLKTLEKANKQGEAKQELRQTLPEKHADYQLSFFQLDDPTLLQIKEEIEQTDINVLTPVEALLKLNEIKKLVGGS